jgi:hypothetical protein
MALGLFNTLTFWKGIVIIHFQWAVHIGKPAFASCIPVNETATKNKRSSFRNRRLRGQVKTEEYNLIAQYPNHCKPPI